MGFDGARADGALERGPGDVARRCMPPDSGAERGDGDRGRLHPRPLLRAFARRRCNRIRPYERARSERTRAIVLVPPSTRGGSTIPHSPTPSAPRGISTASGAARRSPAATSGCSPTMSSAPRSDRQGLFGPWRSWWPALLISISARSAAWHRRAPPIRCRRPSRDPPRTGH